MSLTEILAAIPRLSFAERQQVVRHAMESESDELSTEENAILEQRLTDFRHNREGGVDAVEPLFRLLDEPEEDVVVT